MKQKDIVVIIAVAVVAGIFSVFVSQALFSTKKLNLTAEKVDTISSQFNSPDKNLFSEDPIDPTQLIQIGTGNNAKPF